MRTSRLWVSAVVLTLPTVLLAGYNTGSEPFIDFHVRDAWLLGFGPGVLLSLWAAVAVFGMTMEPQATARTVLLVWAAVGIVLTLSVPWMFFSDLAKYSN